MAASCTIRMEAYTTGKVTTTTKTVPVDIVLVLDQSGSMAYDFNGEDTSTNSAPASICYEAGGKQFYRTRLQRNTVRNPTTRMAIVTFGSNADTLFDRNGGKRLDIC